jgi:hypothetical protein
LKKNLMTRELLLKSWTDYDDLKQYCQPGAVVCARSLLVSKKDSLRLFVELIAAVWGWEEVCRGAGEMKESAAVPSLVVLRVLV